MDALGVQRADIYPRVSTHISRDIIAMNFTLIEKAMLMNSMAMIYITKALINLNIMLVIWPFLR